MRCTRRVRAISCWVLLAAACASDPADPAADALAGAGGVAGATAGSAGTSLAGAAGSAFVPGDFSFCGDRAPISSCSIEATCQELHCGQVGSLLDARGCLAVDCGQDEDCAPGERCLAAHLQTSACLDTYGSCRADLGLNGECICVLPAACSGRVTCMPESVAPRAADCDLTGLDCAALESRIYDLEGDVQVADDHGVPLGPAVTAAIQACLDAIAAEQTTLGCTT